MDSLKNLREKIIEKAKLGTHSAIYASWDVEAAGVYRVIQIANKKPYVAISASRKGFDAKTNNTRSEQLLKDIKEAGLFAYQMIGGYEEVDDDGSKSQVVESSFFVPYNGKCSLTDFINLFIELRDKYNQQAVLIGLPAAFDYKQWESHLPKLKAGGHYFVSKDNVDFVGTTAAIQTFDKYGSIAIDPKKNRIIDWAISGVTTPNGSGPCFLMNRKGLKWFWDGFNSTQNIEQGKSETVKRALSKILKTS